MADSQKLSQSNPEYTVGKVARLFGIPPQTLRFFDEKGISSPEKDESGRRMYSIHNIHNVIARKMYGNVGFSLETSQEIFNHRDLEDVGRMLGGCEDRLNAQLRHLRQQMDGLARLEQQISDVERYLWKVTCRPRPAMWIHPHIIDGRLLDTESVIAARCALSETVPLTSLSFVFHPERISLDPYDCQWFITAEEATAARLGFDRLPSSTLLPGREDCVYTTVRLVGKDALSWDCFSHVTGFLERHRFRIAGEVLGHHVLAAATREGGELTRYYEAWFPIGETAE